MTRTPEPSRAALPGIVRGLEARGYRLVTVSELLAIGAGDAGAASGDSP